MLSIRIWLCDSSGMGLEKRVAVLWKEMWEGLPSLMPFSILEGGCGLKIEILNNWEGREQGGMGACNQHGEIRIHAPSIAVLPDRLAMVVLRHEICHAYLYATNGEHTEALAVRTSNELARKNGWAIEWELDDFDWAQEQKKR